MNRSIEERQGLLKRALKGNAAFSVVSGGLILSANRWLVRLLGLPDNASLVIFGLSLIGYAAVLWLSARRREIRIMDAWVAVILDAIWVVGSYALILVIP